MKLDLTYSMLANNENSFIVTFYGNIYENYSMDSYLSRWLFPPLRSQTQRVYKNHLLRKSMCTFLLVSQNEGHKVEFTPLKDEFQTESIFVKSPDF